MPANDYVRARIDPAIKNEATAVLATMGLTVSDLCRMALTRVAHEKRLPFNLEVPNEETRKAFEAIDNREGLLTPRMRMICSGSWAYKCFSPYSRPLFKRTLSALKNAVTTWKN